MTDTPLTYGRYLKIPELLSLQECLSSPPHHDEPLFIIIHQAYELWFKLVLHELDCAATCLSADQVSEATRLLHRTVEIERLLVRQVAVLETMRPQDFLGFRYHLNPASGFQSVQFREIEFALGIKDRDVLSRLRSSPEEEERLQNRLRAPSLADVLDALLVRRGFPQEPTPQGDVEGSSRSQEWRLQALLAIYRQPDRHSDLCVLCEVLVEIDEWLSLWRVHHIQMVERMIGTRRGTGGSEGVPYLQTTLSKRAFPDLWRLRTFLGDEPGE